VELPWRKAGITAYEVWVSEIMLQQTQVSRVIGYYTRFLERFPTVESLAAASWEEFLQYYTGLGYYARGRNMLRAAVMIVDEYGGEFPRDIAKLQKIPGIGPYTAAAIMSFAYGDRHLAWDTNLKRVVGRFFLGNRNAVIDTNYFESKCTSPRKSLNAALMDFGSALCVARPKCEACPLRSRCVYHREGGKQEVKRQPTKTVAKQDWTRAEAVVILHDRHRAYYSSLRTKYAPFVLSAGYNTRAGIKAYFLKQYGLTLAVRPPHIKQAIGAKRQIFVYAQILLGQPTFRTFAAADIARKH
jgi:A/G-specific adenine glycosylase